MYVRLVRWLFGWSVYLFGWFLLMCSFSVLVLLFFAISNSNHTPYIMIIIIIIRSKFRGRRNLGTYCRKFWASFESGSLKKKKNYKKTVLCASRKHSVFFCFVFLPACCESSPAAYLTFYTAEIYTVWRVLEELFAARCEDTLVWMRKYICEAWGRL